MSKDIKGNSTASNKNETKSPKPTDDNDSLNDQPEAQGEHSAALVKKDFDKMRVAPPATEKEAFGPESYKRMREKAEQDFKFWKSQPMPGFDDPDPEPENSGPIEPNKPIDEIRQTPYALPDMFEWTDCDIQKEEEMDEMYTLLANHYVEDDDNMFRFDYPRPFLKWALMAPGWKKEWHIGVRVTATKKLIAVITAIPCQTRVYDKSFPSVEINFLCVHKKLRSHRLAPVLIQEVTRRVHLVGTFQAVYTAGVVLPKPIAACRYWHRSLNPKKLIETKFSSLAPRMTMARTIKLLRVPEKPKISGLRPMERRDVKAIYNLLNSYLMKFNIANHFSEEEIEHWFLSREGVISTFVVADKNNAITDMLSYYCLPSSVIGHPKYKTIKAAYGFYTVPNAHTIKELMSDALSLAAADGFDVFNCLDLLDYGEILKDLKFGIGDGNLQYYLYNYRTKTMPANHVGLVLL